jgi:fructoselysine-6-P-deglycase FrlB-like protein/phosphoglycolate phosphatase-like HAD superfamily hydrolase
MGRSYESELSEFNETYAWALAVAIEPLAASLAAAVRLPLIAVGSGGSLTSASVAAALHMQFTGFLARVMTPYELAMSSLALKETGILLCTAGGSNPDVLSCFNGLVRREPALLAAICTRLGSPLAKAASTYDWTFCHEFSAPVRKDGFLATNSLLATIVLLIRAYEHIFSVRSSLPPTLDDLLSPGQPLERSLTQLEGSFRPLCERRTLTVLHGAMTQPAATDIESRFTEAALGNVQLADYRNFAHGRHHWLARNADDTAVLILSSPQDKTSAERTAALLPKSIPQLHLQFADGFRGTLSAVVHSIYLGWFAAKAHGIDPGRPKVSQFGRKLYHLRAIPKSPLNGIAIPELEANAIERKSGLTVPTLHTRNQLDEWRTHYRAFRKTLTRTSFHGVIFDYDGTLCGSAERFTALRKEVITGLISLLRAGIVVGIATGRGKSVKEVLRSQIRQRALQKLVIIGYHNAGEIGLLDDDTVPPDAPPLHDSLSSINGALTKSGFVSQNSRREAKGRQITLEAKSPFIIQDLWEHVSDMVPRHAATGVQLVQSTHSIDVLASGVSKRTLLTTVMERLRQNHRDPAVLCIGDRGRWPGNDFELLQHPFALSVDQSSQDPSTCWNLAPPSSRYVDACLYYLHHFEMEPGEFRITGLVEKSS